MFLTLKTLLVMVFHVSASNISHRKCHDYSSAVYSTEYSPILSVKSLTHNVSNCGIVSVPLVVGGDKTLPKEFPHMAAVGYGSHPIKWECGSSLISENFVLTAAHCLYSRENGDARFVRLGTVHLENDSANARTYSVSSRIPHPNYNRLQRTSDIALMRLSEPVVFNAFMRPACLNNYKVLPNSQAWAIGFGKTSYDADSGSLDLMKAQLHIYKNSICASVLRMNFDESLICAGDLSGAKDTCTGDSGGPLQVVLKQPYCMYSIIGVTSFGRFCGQPGSAAVYTNVASFVDWIESIVWPE